MLLPLRLNSCIQNKTKSQNWRKFPELIKAALVQREMLTQFKAQHHPQVCPYAGNSKSLLFLQVFRLDFLWITATCSLPQQDGLAGSTDRADLDTLPAQPKVWKATGIII